MSLLINIQVQGNIPDFSSQTVDRTVRATLKKATNHLLHKLQDNIRHNLKHTVRSGYRYTYTDMLASSFHARVYKSGNKWRGKVGSKLAYAAIHEGVGLGTIIRPKRTRYLTVPLSNTGMELPYPFPSVNRGMFYRRGNLLVLKDTNVPLYVLKTQVRIPARHYASDTLEKEEKEIGQILREGLIGATWKKEKIF